MKKILLVFGSIVLFCVVSTQDASAKIRVPIGTYEKITKVFDLPDNDEYKTEDGRNFDIGLKYQVYQFAFIPIYQEGEAELVGYLDDDTYLALPADYLAELSKKENIENLDSLTTLPFWDAWGGKIVVALIILLIIYGMLPSKKKGEA